MRLVDPERMEQILRVYRAARTTRQAIRGYKRTKRMLDDHREQNDVLMDAEEVAERIREERVRSEDVQNAARFAFNSLPKIYRVVAKHMAKRNAERIAKKVDEKA